jgi:Flp pilus assembly protein TadD
MQHRFISTLLLGAATLTLAACASGTAVKKDVVKNPYDAKINAALQRAADQADSQGSSTGSLVLMERLYKRDPKNPDNAMKFARALRNNGDLQKSALVLQPFADAKDATTETLVEFSTLQLSQSRYPQAESYARKAVDKDADAYRAYQVLGIALDAQNKYKDAEAAFRKGLDLWKGDPIPVMNNLALNLTNQERLPEALEIMERAKAAAPDRPEVERNLRIIRTLNESADGRPAPLPGEKPTPKPVKVE